METRIYHMDPLHPDEGELRTAGEVIRKGGLVAFPTETVYGLGGDALNAASSRKIYAAKGRPSDNPLIVHISKLDSLDRICEHVPESLYHLADNFWPGPLTMIVRKSKEVPYETTGGLDTVAIRMPRHPVALKLIEASGGYIAAPSANISGRPSPTDAEHVIEDLKGRVDVIIDSGHVGIGVESTIIDLSGERPALLRPGFITEEMLSELLGEVEMDATILGGSAAGAPKAPGMRYRHYAPKGTMCIVKGNADAVTSYINRKAAEAKAEGKKTAVLCTDETMAGYGTDIRYSLGARGDTAEMLGRLYGCLRDFDAVGAEVIFSEAFSEEGLGLALMNRLLKAAGHNVIEV